MGYFLKNSGRCFLSVLTASYRGWVCIGWLWFAFTCVALLAGCVGKTVEMPMAVVVKPTACAEMPIPILPQLSSAYSLEDRRNIRLLLERDDSMRAYITGLQATVNCYKAQAAEDDDVRHN